MVGKFSLYIHFSRLATYYTWLCNSMLGLSFLFNKEEIILASIWYKKYISKVIFL